jgi:hypothetical protein
VTGARGEATIQAGDREVTVLFTNRALAEAEARMGKNFGAVARDLADGNFGMNEIAHLLRVGMEGARREARDGRRAISLDDAFDVLDAAGLATVASSVMEAIAAVLGYSSENGSGLEPPYGDKSPNP